MANDGSLASVTEQWIVDTLVALDDFDASDVEVFEGTVRPDGRELVGELTRHASPYVTVLFEGDRAIPLEQGDVRYVPTYAIYVVVQSKRAGAARKGDAEIMGTNKLRDVIRAALHDKFPGLSAGGYATDHTEFGGVQVVFQRTDAFIMRGELVVHESQAP